MVGRLIVQFAGGGFLSAGLCFHLCQPAERKNVGGAKSREKSCASTSGEKPPKSRCSLVLFEPAHVRRCQGELL